MALIDPKLYEQVALEKALEFYGKLKDFYKSQSQAEMIDFLGSYCNSFMEKRSMKKNEWRKFECEACKQELNGQKQWDEHVKTRKHKNRIAGGKKSHMTKVKPKEEKNSEYNDDIELGLFGEDDS